MLMRLTMDLFKTVLYDAKFSNDKLLLCSEEEEIKIPLKDIREFSMEGDGKQVKKFIMQTDSVCYEGFFINANEAEEFINLLRNNVSCYVDIHIETK